MSAEYADQAVRAYWRQTNAWIETDTASWRYDDERGTLLLALTGRAKLDWTGDDAEGRGLDIFGAGFTPPVEYHRPKGQDQSAPWMTQYPAYRCWVTAIYLPTAPIGSGTIFRTLWIRIWAESITGGLQTCATA